MNKFFPALASIGALMVFTRLMSPEQFGEYSLTINVSAVVVAILGNFLILGIGRFEPATKTEGERAKLHSTVITTALLLSICVAVIITVLGIFCLLPALSVNYYFIAILFHISLFQLLSQKLINANLQPARYGLSLALRNIFLLLIGASGLLLGYGVQAVLGSLALASLVASIPARRLWAKISFRFYDLGILKSLWSYGAPLTFLYLFVMIITLSDRVFIDVMLGSSEVGLYAAGYDLTQYILGVIASILHLAAFPIILKTYEAKGYQETVGLLSNSIRILLLMMIPATLGFISLRSDISHFVLGDDFSKTSLALMPFLAFSVLFSAIKSYYFDYTFQLAKATWLQAVPPMIAAICNLFLNYILILRFELIGAVYATLISYIIYLIFSAYLSRRVFVLPAFPWWFFLKVGFSSLIMFFVLSIIDNESQLILILIFKILLGMFIFIMCSMVIMKGEIFDLIGSIKYFK